MENKISAEFENGYLERFEVLRSMSIGLCNDLARQMENAQRHLELLQDELEMDCASKTAMRYLNDNRNIAERMRSLLNWFLTVLPESDFMEVANLQAMVRGVLAQYGRLTKRAEQFACAIPEGLQVRCNVYQFQQLLFSLLEFFDEQNNHSGAEGHIRAAVREFGEGEKEVMQLACNPGKYIMLSLGSGNVAETWHEPVSLGALADDSERWPHPLMQTLGWLGFIQGMGGELVTERNEPGKYLCLLLPEDTRGATDMAAAAEPVAGPENAKTILLVDDEEMIWEVISAMLGDMGYNVILAGNGREAISIYESNPGEIDLVMLDMLMPELSGRETFFRLQKIDPKVKVLMTSGYVSGEDIQDVLKAGACGFLQKPYRMKELADCITRIFNQ